MCRCLSILQAAVSITSLGLWACWQKAYCGGFFFFLFFCFLFLFLCVCVCVGVVECDLPGCVMEEAVECAVWSGCVGFGEWHWASPLPKAVTRELFGQHQHISPHVKGIPRVNFVSNVGHFTVRNPHNASKKIHQWSKPRDCVKWKGS